MFKAKQYRLLFENKNRLSPRDMRKGERLH